MSTITLVVSPDGKTTIPAAGSRLIEVDCEQYTNEPAQAISDATPILTLPPDDQLERLAGAFRNPPSGTADPQALALARLLADVAFGTGGLDDRYRLVPAVHHGDVVLVFAEATSDGLTSLAEMWPPRDDYTTITPGDSNDSEQLLARPDLPPLEVALFPRYRDGSTSDALEEITAASVSELLLAIATALKRVQNGIYDPASTDETPESRAIGLDITLVPAA
jgi:hypothetical protein